MQFSHNCTYTHSLQTTEEYIPRYTQEIRFLTTAAGRICSYCLSRESVGKELATWVAFEGIKLRNTHSEQIRSALVVWQKPKWYIGICPVQEKKRSKCGFRRIAHHFYLQTLDKMLREKKILYFFLSEKNYERNQGVLDVLRERGWYKFLAVWYQA